MSVATSVHRSRLHLRIALGWAKWREEMKVWAKCVRKSGEGTWVAGIVGTPRRAFGTSGAKAKYRLLMDLLRGRIAAEIAATSSREQIERLLLDGCEGLRWMTQDALVQKARETGLSDRNPEVEETIALLAESEVSKAVDEAARAIATLSHECRAAAAKEALTQAFDGELVTPGMVALAVSRADTMCHIDAGAPTPAATRAIAQVNAMLQ